MDAKKKKIKTESGNWISASYKSNAYEEWRTRTRYEDREENSDEDEIENPRRKKSGGDRGGRGGKFVVVGTRKRKWHTKGMEDEASSRQSKQKFKRGKGGQLRSTDEILKTRRKKAKVQNFQKYRQNVRAKRKGKELGGKGKGKRKQ